MAVAWKRAVFLEPNDNMFGEINRNERPFMVSFLGRVYDIIERNVIHSPGVSRPSPSMR